jgi:hypothetical protein
VQESLRVRFLVTRRRKHRGVTTERNGVGMRIDYDRQLSDVRALIDCRTPGGAC